MKGPQHSMRDSTIKAMPSWSVFCSPPLSVAPLSMNRFLGPWHSRGNIERFVLMCSQSCPGFYRWHSQETTLPCSRSGRPPMQCMNLVDPSKKPTLKTHLGNNQDRLNTDQFLNFIEEIVLTFFSFVGDK